jgi:putative FmdB family regulatory protein
MPIYEYVCDDCGNHYERIVKNEKTEVNCPSCDSGKSTIQLSVFAAPANGSKSSSSSPAMPAMAGRCGSGCGCH